MSKEILWKSIKARTPSFQAKSPSFQGKSFSFNAGVKNKESVEYIIESPIRCGFLVAFCKHEYNLENMNFLIAVMRFKDILKMDGNAWTKSWRQLDEELQDRVFNIDGHDDDSEAEVSTSWPSTKVNRKAAVETMQKIIDEYIYDDAPYEICCSKQIQANTLRRANLIDFYGPEVFNEATVDPIKTMKKDILPRFLSSVDFAHMKERLESCATLPSPSELTVPKPNKKCIDNASLESFPPNRKFELNEFLECEILYGEFMRYLFKCVCSENLSCLRMINIFEELMSQDHLEEAEELAWKIYRFFVAAGAPYEISLNYVHRRTLCLTMAQPHINMYNEVKKSVQGMLKMNFEGYKDTKDYEGLASKLRSIMIHGQPLRALSCQSEMTKKRTSNRLACFGL